MTQLEFNSDLGVNLDSVGTRPDFRAGDRLRAAQLSEATALGRNLTTIEPPRQLSPAPPSSQVVEVRIHRAIRQLSDAQAWPDPRAVTTFQKIGPYLLCFKLNEAGEMPPVNPDIEVRPFTPVRPSRNQIVAEFVNPLTGDQIFDAEDPEGPIYYAVEVYIGQPPQLLVGDGQDWATAPLPDEVCGAGPGTG